MSLYMELECGHSGIVGQGCETCRAVAKEEELTALRQENERLQVEVAELKKCPNEAWECAREIALLKKERDELEEQYLEEHAEAVRQFGRADEARDRVTALEARVKALSEELQFYADEENWQRKVVFRCGDGCCTDYAGNADIYEDGGERARQAIEQHGWKG